MMTVEDALLTPIGLKTRPAFAIALLKLRLSGRIGGSRIARCKWELAIASPQMMSVYGDARDRD